MKYFIYNLNLYLNKGFLDTKFSLFANRLFDESSCLISSSKPKSRECEFSQSFSLTSTLSSKFLTSASAFWLFSIFLFALLKMNVLSRFKGEPQIEPKKRRGIGIGVWKSEIRSSSTCQTSRDEYIEPTAFRCSGELQII